MGMSFEGTESVRVDKFLCEGGIVTLSPFDFDCMEKLRVECFVRRGRRDEGVICTEDFDVGIVFPIDEKSVSPCLFDVFEEDWPIIPIETGIFGDDSDDKCPVVAETIRASCTHHRHETTDECQDNLIPPLESGGVFEFVLLSLELIVRIIGGQLSEERFKFEGLRRFD
jgi:hypothetical protein